MPEGANVEVAHHLTEHGNGHGHRNEHHRSHRVLEIVEVVLLAVVADRDGWSGFQAAKWDGRQTEQYGEANSARFRADELDNVATVELTADSALLTAWLEAQAAGDVELQDLLEHRMTRPYKVAFDAWLETDPFANPNAPSGPVHMSEYRNPARLRAAEINDQASKTFDEGTEAREHGEKYVRNTVLLAMILFVAAVAPRFKDPLLRGVLNGIGVVLLVYTLVSLASLPKA